jgi:hypothetical protein
VAGQPRVWDVGRHLDPGHGNGCAEGAAGSYALPWLLGLMRRRRCKRTGTKHCGWAATDVCSRHAGSYYRPEGFAFGDVEGQTEQLMDDENATEPNNVAQRVDDFVAAAKRMAAHIDGNDIMFTMGGESAAAQNLLLCVSMSLYLQQVRPIYAQVQSS